MGANASMMRCGRIISFNRAKEEVVPDYWKGHVFEKQMSMSVFTEGVKVPEKQQEIYNLHLKTPLDPYLGQSVRVRLVHDGHNLRYLATLRYSFTPSREFEMHFVWRNNRTLKNLIRREFPEEYAHIFRVNATRRTFPVSVMRIWLDDRPGFFRFDFQHRPTP